MSEKETLFNSKVKIKGIFSMRDFYKFCYDWLTEETRLDVAEKKYEEEIKGDMKELTIEWVGTSKVTDYFKYEMNIKFEVKALKEVEVIRNGVKEKSNSGSVKINMKGNLIRDYDGKFETSGFQKFMRGIYEKWVIPARIEEYEEKLIGVCDGFLNQAKAWMDLEGRK